MLVGDVAHDLLDQVLEGHHAVGAAVLVDDDRHLHALLAQQGQQRIELDAVGHGGRRGDDVADAHIASPVGRDADGLLDVDDAEHVVGATADHRETRVAGLPGRLDDVVRGVAAFEEVHADPRGAYVRSGAVAERDAAGDQIGRLVVELTLDGGPQDQRAQLDR